MLRQSTKENPLNKTCFSFTVQYTWKCMNFTHLNHKPIKLCMISKWKKILLGIKLVRNNRKRGHNLIDDLYVNGETYSGKENVLQGFTEHFRQLATNNQNNESEYHRKIEQEIQLINQLVKNKAIPVATLSELEKSIKSINTGKSADIYNITIEHIINAGEQMITILLQIVNAIFDHGSVPDILKVGLLTPVFKNKGNIAEVINYRGITVLPVINKIIETIIKNRTSH